MQRCKNGRYTWQDYIKTIDTAAGLETLEEFKFGLEEVWEKECSSDSDVDEVLLMNKTVTSPLVQSVVTFIKSFKLG